MRYVIAVVLILVGTLVSCNQDDDENTKVELEGQWKLIETLVDPGDGSGTFHDVNSLKNIVFHTDGTVTSNGSLCNMFIEPNSPSSGIYSIQDSTITPTNCNDLDKFKMKFRLNNSTLIINYQCIEACQEKYSKVE